MKYCLSEAGISLDEGSHIAFYDKPFLKFERLLGTAIVGRFREIVNFMKVRKKWWLTPIIVVPILLSPVLVLTKGSVLAPFIYAIF